jgi:succinyl-diaminopimelate desuccinylase
MRLRRCTDCESRFTGASVWCRGSGFLAATKRLGANGVGMLTPEPTSGVVWNANRGAISLRVTVYGREAHVGLLHQGRNAFEDAIGVVAGLQRLARRVGRRYTQFKVTPDAARRSLMLIGGRVEAGSNSMSCPAAVCSRSIGA